MGNCKNRYQQRSYKYQEQERVPEYFSEYDDSDYEYYDDYSYYWPTGSEWSWLSDSAHCINDGDSVDDIRTDKTLPEEVVVDSCGKDKNCYARNKVYNKFLISLSFVELRNRYSVLDEDGKEVTIQNSLGEEDTSSDQIIEDESKWSVYHCKSSKKRNRIMEKEIAASSKSVVVVPVADETAVALQKQQKHEWIDSWCKKHDSIEKSTTGSVADEDGFWVVNIEGFFREKRKAGYGVIIRDRCGVPLVASSGVSDQGEPISELYHELQGLNRGLELAIKYGLLKIQLYCSVRLALNVIVYSRSFAGLAPGPLGMVGCYCQDRNHNLDLNIVCKRCIDAEFCLFDDRARPELVYPLIQEILHKFSMFDGSPKFDYRCTRRRYNVAADYLAKLQVKQEEVKPDEFSEELKDILYEDAHNSEMMYSKLRQWWD